MAGTIRMYEDKAGSYRFSLAAGDGEMLAVSQGFGSKARLLTEVGRFMTVCESNPPTVDQVAL